MNFDVTIYGAGKHATVVPQGDEQYEPAMAFMALLVANVKDILNETEDLSYVSRFYHEQYNQNDGIELKGLALVEVVDKLKALRLELRPVEKVKAFIQDGVSEKGLRDGGELFALASNEYCQKIARDTATVLIVRALMKEPATC